MRMQPLQHARSIAQPRRVACLAARLQPAMTAAARAFGLLSGMGDIPPGSPLSALDMRLRLTQKSPRDEGVHGKMTLRNVSFSELGAAFLTGPELAVA